MKNKFSVLTLCLLLIVSTITGCGLQGKSKNDNSKESDTKKETVSKEDKDTKKKEEEDNTKEEKEEIAKTAQEVIERQIKAKKDKLNANVNMNFGFDIKIKYNGETSGIDAEVEQDFNIVDEKAVLASKSVMNIDGTEDKSDDTIYLQTEDGVKCVYEYSEDLNSWTREEFKEDATNFSFNINKLEDFESSEFKDAELDYDESSKEYTITSIIKDKEYKSGVINFIGMLKESMGTNMLALASNNYEELGKEVFKEITLICKFDSKYNLLSVEMSDIEYTGEIEENGETAELTYKLSFDYQISKRDEIKEADVALPDEVKNNWVPSVTLNADENNTEENNSEEDDSNTDSESSNGGYIQGVDGYYGTINGISLTCKGDSWDKTFGASGWEFGDEYTSFITASNSKYENVEMYVYSENKNGNNKQEINKTGLYGYSIELYNEDADYKDINWRGIKLKASMDDVKKVYGTPSDTINNTYTTVYVYNESEIELQFHFNEKGLLYRVEAINW